MPDENNETQLCEIELRKRPTHFEIYLKSAALEDHFRQLSNGEFTATQASLRESYPAEYYNLSPAHLVSLRDLALSRFDLWGSQELFSSGKVNLSLLRARGLRDGLTFRINTPISPKAQREFWERFNEAVGEFYDTFLRPEDVRAEFVIYEQQTTSRT